MKLLQTKNLLLQKKILRKMQTQRKQKTMTMTMKMTLMKQQMSERSRVNVIQYRIINLEPKQLRVARRDTTSNSHLMQMFDVRSQSTTFVMKK